MPPRSTRKPKPPAALCAVHFPNGLADQPREATVVSCEHGAWPGPAADPVPPVAGRDAGRDGE